MAVTLLSPTALNSPINGVIPKKDGVMPKNAINLGSGVVTVGWSKDAPVAQIGVGRYSALREHANDVVDSLFTDFTERSQINLLIRALRTARDQAFGRDE